MTILAVTSGDPAGIGPEVAVRAAAREEVRAAARILLVGAPGAFSARDPAPAFASAEEFAASGEAVGWLSVGEPFPAEARRPEGIPNAECGRASLAAIHAAVDLALGGAVDGIVTAPVNKQAMLAAGSPHAGHTELLAGKCGAERVVMMLTGGGLRVGLVTVHSALRDVAALITREAVLGALGVMAKDLRRYFGIEDPRILVCGLNPHASDGGAFGDEEARAIAPAVEEARAEGIRASGPAAGDAAFHRQLEGEADAVLAMYHDQGLAPLKTLAFDTGVNVTLGLPVVRTSPDHGTAFDIAGQGRAKDTSMREAILLASRMSKVKHKA